jgi:hypothetical protein
MVDSDPGFCAKIKRTPNGPNGPNIAQMFAIFYQFQSSNII